MRTETPMVFLFIYFQLGYRIYEASILVKSKRTIVYVVRTFPFLIKNLGSHCWSWSSENYGIDNLRVWVLIIDNQRVRVLIVNNLDYTKRQCSYFACD